MPALAESVVRKEVPTSCGTIITNDKGQILLCHVTGTDHWDIPKGMQDRSESTLAAAKRELHEETGLVFDDALFREIGGFGYQKDKRLHLYALRAPDSLNSLEQLVCTSHFQHRTTGELMPEMDAFCWASRDDISKLCTLRMAELLLSLEW